MEKFHRTILISSLAAAVWLAFVAVGVRALASHSGARSIGEVDARKRVQSAGETPRISLR